MIRIYISDAVIGQTVKGIRGILEESQRDIETAFLNEENALSVSISVKYSLEKEAIKIETSMNLVKERLKIKTAAIIDDSQRSLFEVEEELKHEGVHLLDKIAHLSKGQSEG